MAPVKVEDRIADVMKLLKDNNTTRIVLTGKNGIGKTWTARKVLEQARKSYGAVNNHLDFGFTLWVSMNQKFDKFSLYDKIASQLILPSNEGEEDDDDNDLDQDGQVDESKERMLEKLKKNVKAKLANRRYLLIMDDEGGNGMTDNFLMAELNNVLPAITERNSKILITKTEDDDASTIANDKTFIIAVEPLLEEESCKLLKQIVDSLSDSQLKAITQMCSHLPDQIVVIALSDSQLKAITQMCSHLPDQIVVIANLLRFLKKFSDEDGHFNSIFEEIVSVNDYQKATDLLANEFAVIPKLNMKFPVIEAADMKFACSWYGRRIFEASKCSIHYNDLITYWMFEGCLGHVDKIDKAYEAGHSLLLELIELGLLTKHDDNFVSMNRLFVEVKDHRRYGFRGISSLGLENIFQDDIWEGVGRLSKSVAKNQKYNKKVSALLLDSHHLAREVPESLFERFSSLRVLGLFNPSFESIPTSFSSLKQLNVLVIRGCPFLNNVVCIEELQNLIILEITGASSLKEMPETLFKNMTRLRAISISAAKITSVPKISDQLDLRRIILRNCSCLERVPFIPKCKDLEVIDIFGCTSMKIFEDKTFEVFLELQYLDVSNTKLDSLPLLKKLRKLSRLILSNTPTSKLRLLNDLTGLEIMDVSTSDVLKNVHADVFTNKTALRVIDFSGTQVASFCSIMKDVKFLETINLSNNLGFKSFDDDSLENLEHLRVIDVSNTSILKLPNLINLPNLRRLLLNDCKQLEELGKMEGLTKLEKIDLSNAEMLESIANLNHENLRSILLPGCKKLLKLPTLSKVTKLEELDLSGCESLKEIEDQSFDHLTKLKKLKLSKTKIHALPSLSALTNLEELDLSGIEGLVAIEGDVILQQMKKLQILNLSGIPQVALTSVSHLPKIKQLIVNGCTDIGPVMDLEKLTELEILDISNTSISSLPYLESFPNLRRLLLRNLLKMEELSDLKSVKKLEVLDLFGTGLKDFPYEISDLPCLTDVSLPEISGCHVEWGQINWLPEISNLEECGLFEPTETNAGSGNVELSITVTSTKLFKFFEKFPKLWETCFTKFQISVCSPEYIADRDPLLSSLEADMFRDIYTIHTTKSIDHCHTRCLDIRGFDTISSSLSNVLRYAEYVSITDNTSVKSLQNVGAGNMKRLWIERCNNLENILNVEEDAGLVPELEVLCASNMVNLKTILYKKNEVMHVESFISLKEMYLDCCPELVTLFTSGKTPGNLEIIDIKFCDKLEAVFGEATCEMGKLRSLRLLQLPQLKTVGYKLKSVEKLETIKIEYCDTLKMFSEEASGLELPSLREVHLQSLPLLEHIGRFAESTIVKRDGCPLFLAGWPAP